MMDNYAIDVEIEVKAGNAEQAHRMVLDIMRTAHGILNASPTPFSYFILHPYKLIDKEMNKGFSESIFSGDVPYAPV